MTSAAHDAPLVRCVALTPAVDVVHEMDQELRAGAINRPIRVHRRAGGKGTNVARVIGRLGGRARLVGVVGGITGRWFAELASQEGMQSELVEADVETRLCLTIAGGRVGPTDIYEPHDQVPRRAWKALVDAELTAAAAWTVVSGSVPRGAGAADLSALVSAAAGGRPVALDGHGRAVGEALRTGLPLAVLKVNRHEAAALLGHDAAPKQLCADLRRLSRAGLVVVTCGSAGSVASADRATWHLSGGQHGAHPTGSGDAFLAGLVVALAAELKVPEALRHAAAAAAVNAVSVTAGDVRPDLLAGAYEAITVERQSLNSAC